MGFDHARIVQRRRHTYRGHTFWTVGCAPADERMEGLLAPMTAVGPGTIRNEVLSRGLIQFYKAFWHKMGWREDDGAGPHIQGQRAKLTEKAWTEAAATGHVQSPRDAVLARWHTRMDWYVCDHDEGTNGPGEPLREIPFCYPTHCLAEDIMIGRLFPRDDLPDMLPGQGRDLALTPTQSSDPADVAMWWGAFYFGHKRTQKVRLRVRGSKEELEHKGS